jgi:hypothetical protein
VCSQCPNEQLCQIQFLRIHQAVIGGRLLVSPNLVRIEQRVSN